MNTNIRWGAATFCIVMLLVLRDRHYGAQRHSAFDTLPVPAFDANDSLVATLPAKDSLLPQKDSANTPEKPAFVLEKRWMIAPLTKFHAIDFGMTEKNSNLHLSDVHELSFKDRSTLLLAASAYKNISGRISFSTDIGYGKGRIGTAEKKISETDESSYTLLNLGFYIHLLKPEFRMQPFISGGLNSLMGEEAFASAPLGAGFKYQAKKIMVMAQAAYGMSVTDNIAPAMQYSAGLYFPIGKKKEEKKKPGKKKEEEEKPRAKTDTAANNNGGTVINIVNNYYYGSPPDSARNGMPPVRKKKDPANEDEMREQMEWGDDVGWEEGADVVTPKAYDPNEPMTFKKARKFMVYFEYDDYSLTATAFREADKVVRLMRQNPDLLVHVKGHTDLRGSGVYNIPLSKKRAQMVYDYLNSRGIAKERMELSYFGKDKPITEADDPDKAWMNRRAEIVIYER